MHTAPAINIGLQAFLATGVRSFWFSLAAILVALSPFLGPALDHHFAERIPSHLHLFSGSIDQDHEHGHAHSHDRNGGALEQFSPDIAASSEVAYLAQFDGLSSPGATALQAPADESKLALQSAGELFWDGATITLLPPKDIYPETSEKPPPPPSPLSSNHI